MSLAPVDQTVPEPDDAEEAAPPPDPRAAPEVKRALRRAARRDPHPDILKPVGRIAFFISLAVLFWLAQPFYPVKVPSVHAGGDPAAILLRHIAELGHRIYAKLAGLDLRALARFDVDPEQAVFVFVAGIFALGSYYATVYLAGANVRRLIMWSRGALRFGGRIAGAAAQGLRRGDAADAAAEDENIEPSANAEEAQAKAEA